MTDWRRILLAYIDHVLNEEGTTFGADSYHRLNEEETMRLNDCICEVLDDPTNRSTATEVTDYADTIKEIEVLSTPFLDKAKKGRL